jgi:hypothetical protein
MSKEALLEQRMKNGMMVSGTATRQTCPYQRQQREEGQIIDVNAEVAELRMMQMPQLVSDDNLVQSQSRRRFQTKFHIEAAEDGGRIYLFQSTSVCSVGQGWIEGENGPRR